MKKTILTVMVMSLSLVSCTDAGWAKLGGLGDESLIEMIDCNGSVSHSWVSTGKVYSEKDSDGCYFKDKATGKFIEVTGRLIITKQ